MSDNNQRWRKLMLTMTVAYSLAALIWAYIHPYVWVRSPQENWESLTKLITPQPDSKHQND